MNELQSFYFPAGGAAILVRALGTTQEPWFVASDVARALGVADVSSAVSRLDEDEKGTACIGTLGGTQTVLTVNEAGLFHLALTCRTEQAAPFKRWACHEVLPSIRKTGTYSVTPVVEETKPVSAKDEVIEQMLGSDPIAREAKSLVELRRRQFKLDMRFDEVRENLAMLLDGNASPEYLQRQSEFGRRMYQRDAKRAEAHKITKGPAPVVQGKCLDFITTTLQQAGGEMSVKDLRVAYEAAGFSASTAYKLLDRGLVEQFNRAGRIWWRLPGTAAAQPEATILGINGSSPFAGRC